MMIKDPDGHNVEMVQYMPGSLHTRNFGKFLPPTRISERIIHVGVIVEGQAAADRFYKDILGFREMWHGGRTDAPTDWVDMRVPEGTDWLEYMLNVQAIPRRRREKGLNHLASAFPPTAAAPPRRHRTRHAKREAENRPPRRQMAVEPLRSKSHPGRVDGAGAGRKALLLAVYCSIENRACREFRRRVRRATQHAAHFRKAIERRPSSPGLDAARNDGVNRRWSNSHIRLCARARTETPPPRPSGSRISPRASNVLARDSRRGNRRLADLLLPCMPLVVGFNVWRRSIVIVSPTRPARRRKQPDARYLGSTSAPAGVSSVPALPSHCPPLAALRSCCRSSKASAVSRSLSVIILQP